MIVETFINSHPAAERDEVRGEDTLGGAAV